MLPDLQEELAFQQQRRDRALQRLETSVESATETIASRVDDFRGGFLKGLVRSSPFAACFASLGAGALLARLVAPGPAAGSGEPQRVVVEVQAPGGPVVPQAAQAPFNPLDLMMQALTVYGAVRRSMTDLASDSTGSAESNEDGAQNGPLDNPV